MKPIMLPLSEAKAFCRKVKRTNVHRPVHYTEVLNHTVQFLGFKDYSHYQRAYKSLSGRDPISFDVPTDMNLHRLEELNQGFMEHFKALGIDLPDYGYCCYEVADAFDENPSGIPCVSTPFSRYIEDQIVHLKKLPPLRVSGFLYLLTYLSGLPVYDENAWVIDGTALIGAINDRELPTALCDRLLMYSRKNKEEFVRYPEGLLCELIFRFRDKEVDDQGLVSEIEGLLKEERDYLSKVNPYCKPRSDLPPFNFPVSSASSKYRNKKGFRKDDVHKAFQQIRERICVHEPLLLGIKSKRSSVFSFSEPECLTLNKESILDNILITGVPGCGSHPFLMSLVHQAIMNRSGALILNAEGRQDVIWVVTAFLKAHNREDDLMVLTINHDISSAKLMQYIEAKKIILIALPSCEKDPEVFRELYMPLWEELWKAISALDRKKLAGYFPYLLALHRCLEGLPINEDPGFFSGLIEAANDRNIGVIATSDWPLRSKTSEPVVLESFRNRAIMKLEEIGAFEIPGMTDDDQIQLMTLKKDHFVYWRNDEDFINTEYHTPLRQIEDMNHLYLSMF